MSVALAGPSLQPLCKNPWRPFRTAKPQSDFQSKRLSTASGVLNLKAATVDGWAIIGTTPRLEPEAMTTILNTMQKIMRAERRLPTRLHRKLRLGATYSPLI